MTKYIKTGTTEFEQFDGSDEMCKKYGIRKDTEYLISDDPLEYQIAPYQIESLEGWLNLNVDDWIATGAEGEHWPVKDEIFQKTYKKIPTILKVVATWIETCKNAGTELLTMMDDTYSVKKLTSAETNQIQDWMDSHMDSEISNTIARAWLDGYEVEEVE